jgi:hypothetical protein
MSSIFPRSIEIACSAIIENTRAVLQGVDQKYHRMNLIKNFHTVID